MSCGSGLWVTLLVVNWAVPKSKRHQKDTSGKQGPYVSKTCQAGQCLMFFLTNTMFFEGCFWGGTARICWSIMKYLCFRCWVAIVAKDWQNHLKNRHLGRLVRKSSVYMSYRFSWYRLIHCVWAPTCIVSTCQQHKHHEISHLTHIWATDIDI